MGGTGCFLFTLLPKLHIYSPSGISKNFVIYNPGYQGSLRATSYLKGGDSAVPEVAGSQITHQPWALCDPCAHQPWALCDPCAHQPWALCGLLSYVGFMRSLAPGRM